MHLRSFSEVKDNQKSPPLHLHMQHQSTTTISFSQIGKIALDQNDPASFGQIHSLSTVKATLNLLNNLIPYIFCLKSGPKWKPWMIGGDATLKFIISTKLSTLAA